MRVNTNVNALIANNQMSRNVAGQGSSMEKLSSGLRIKRAADDAAGLAISEKMRAQIKGLNQAERNVQDGMSVVQTAEGALEETGNILQRMKELTTQAASETNTSSERSKIANELKALNDEITRISDVTEFNGQKLLKEDKALTIQVGAGTASANQISISLKNTAGITGAAGISSASIGAITGDGATGTAGATTLMNNISTALDEINEARADLGAQQNRLQSTQNNLNTTIENTSAAESRIRDVDVAKEMMNLSKMNILVQASQSMLAQANQQPQGVLQLLG